MNKFYNSKHNEIHPDSCDPSPWTLGKWNFIELIHENKLGIGGANINDILLWLIDPDCSTNWMMIDLALLSWFMWYFILIIVS